MFTSKKSLNHYEVLELKSSCTKHDIKQNFLRLAKIYHPDVYRGVDKGRYTLIQDAYQILKSPEKRRKYDYEQMGQSEIHKPPPQEEDEPQPQGQNVNEHFEFKDYKASEPLKPDEVVQEYEKFMSKPMTSDPGELLVYENIFTRQQTKEYKEQARFLYYRNNMTIYIMTHAHRMGYHEQVKQYIDSANAYIDRKKTNTTDKVIQQTTRRNKWIWLGVFGVTVMLLPIVQSGFTRRKQVERWMEQDRMKLKELTDQSKILETQQRLIY